MRIRARLSKSSSLRNLFRCSLYLADSVKGMLDRRLNLNDVDNTDISNSVLKMK